MNDAIDVNNTSGNALVNAGLKLQMGELRHAHVELEKSRDYYLTLFNYSPNPYLVLNDDGMISECNNAAAKLFGVERNKLSKWRFSRFIPEEYKDFWNRHYLLAKQSDSIQSCELSLLRADKLTSVYVQLDCLYRQVSEDVRLLFITINDITGYRQTDERLRIAAVAFETQDGIIVTDANKNILRVNEAFSRITGYGSEEAVGKPSSFLCARHLDESFHQALWVTVYTYGFWQGEVMAKRMNGEEFPIWLTVTAVIGQDECISHYVFSFTDITAQKQAEKILLDARHRLENQVTTTKEELEKVKQKTDEINAALTVLLKHRETDKTQSQQALSREVEETILPFLNKLKKASAGRVQSSQLLNILEDNLTQLINAYGSKNTVSTAFHKLTPLEAQVAIMVRQGMATKVIANTLNISEGTVSIHRNHIRKKLGLNCKSDNLQVYLKTLIE